MRRLLQEALIAYLRQRSNSGGRPIFFSTRSSAILDLTAVGANERIIFCPANHSPPSYVIPRPARSTSWLPPVLRHRPYGRGPRASSPPDLMYDHRRTEATPFFERICPAMTKSKWPRSLRRAARNCSSLDRILCRAPDLPVGVSQALV